MNEQIQEPPRCIKCGTELNLEWLFGAYYCPKHAREAEEEYGKFQAQVDTIIGEENDRC